MSLEQVVGPVLAAVVGGVSGIALERTRQKREREKDQGSSSFALQQAQIADDAARRAEIADAERRIREFLQAQVTELHQEVTSIEDRTAVEREKWNQMLGTLSTK